VFFFFRGPFEKTGVFLVMSNYMNPEDNYGRLVDFLSQISKLPCFNVLDFVGFMIHH